MSLYLPLFKALNDANVKYVVVGGLATVLHGYVRATADLDLVIDLQKSEAEKAIRTLTNFGLKPHAQVDPMGFADASQRTRWIAEKSMEVFSLYHPDHQGLVVDLFSRHPIPFESLWLRSVIMKLGSTDVRVCSIDDLIELKRLVGRPQDLVDIEKLSKIRTYGKPIKSE